MNANLSRDTMFYIAKNSSPSEVLQLCSTNQVLADLCREQGFMARLVRVHYPDQQVSDDAPQQYRDLTRGRVCRYDFYVRDRQVLFATTSGAQMPPAFMANKRKFSFTLFLKYCGTVETIWVVAREGLDGHAFYNYADARLFAGQSGYSDDDIYEIPPTAGGELTEPTWTILPRTGKFIKAWSRGRVGSLVARWLVENRYEPDINGLVRAHRDGKLPFFPAPTAAQDEYLRFEGPDGRTIGISRDNVSSNAREVAAELGYGGDVVDMTDENTETIFMFLQQQVEQGRLQRR